MTDLLADSSDAELEQLKTVWLNRLERLRSEAAAIAAQEQSVLRAIRRIQGESDRREKCVDEPRSETWQDVVREVIKTAPRDTPVRNVVRAVEALCDEEGLAAPKPRAIAAAVMRFRLSAKKTPQQR